MIYMVKPRWPHSIFTKIRHGLDFEEKSDKLDLFRANTNPIFQNCRLSRHFKPFKRLKNNFDLFKMDPKETPVNDASNAAKTSGERREEESIERREGDGGEVQYSLLQQVDIGC